ncbi:MAG: right-handed parallel beta-helix repeat-containing protein [Planctomycetota bacterium]
MRTFLPPAVLLVLCPVASAQVIYVDADLTTGLNDGSTWSDAFQGPGGVQAALAAAVSGDSVFAAQGDYLPSSTGDRGASFVLKDAVALYGGFLGGETSPDERPPFGTAPSVLSGDLAGDDGGGLFDDNSYHVVIGNADAGALLDGFTVRSGNANGAGANEDRGAGILCAGDVAPALRNCRFASHRCTFGGAAGHLSAGAAPSFVDCSFVDGDGAFAGGALDLAGAGAVRFDRCLFENNTASRGGALELFGTDDVLAVNCVFRGNTATGPFGGGAIFMNVGQNNAVRSCTIVGNSATASDWGGIHDPGAPAETVVNCILWDNSGSDGSQGSENQVNAGTNVQYSIVEGGYAGTGNLAGDPLFADAAAGDFSLTLASPAIDAGFNAGVPPAILLDFAQNPRFADEPTVPDTGAGAAPIVDIGAIESIPSPFIRSAGCSGNPLLLSGTGSTFAVGQAFGLQLDAGAFPTGLAFYFGGFDGTDGFGCGFDVPGLGELLLSLVLPSFPVGTAPMTAGASSLALALPNDPGLAGQTFGFQAVHAPLGAPGAPIELSGLVLGTVAP